MLGISVEKFEDKLVVKWQLSKFEIPLTEIIEMTLDDTYGGEAKDAVRIGTPYGTTDRVVIRTRSKTYVLFTTNAAAIQNKVGRYLAESEV